MRRRLLRVALHEGLERVADVGVVRLHIGGGRIDGQRLHLLLAHQPRAGGQAVGGSSGEGGVL